MVSAEEHKSLNGGNLAPSTCPFDDVLDVKPLNDVSQSMDPLSMPKDHGSLTSGNLATQTSAFSDVPSNNISHNMGLSYDETNNLGIKKEKIPLTNGNMAPATSPFGDDVGFFLYDVPPSTGSSSANVSHLDTAKQHRSPFDDVLDVPLDNPETSPSVTAEEHKSLATENLTPISPFGEDVDVQPLNHIPHPVGLSSDETNQFATAKENVLLANGSNGVYFGSLNNFSQSPLPVVKEHASLTSGSLANATFPSSDGVDVKPLNQKLSSSSPLDNVFGEATHMSAQVGNSEPPISPLPVSTQPMRVASRPTSKVNNFPATEFPPNQVMERPGTSKYRIPSHVFKRTKSNAPVDWSVASNESLFSIQMGNSFTTDHFAGKYEDFGVPADVNFPGQRINYQSNQLTPIKTAVGDSHDVGIKEADLEKAKNVSRGSEDISQEKLSAEGRISQYSEESAVSTKSFNFPILTDVEKCTSISMSSPAGSGIPQHQTQTQNAAATKSKEEEQKQLNPKQNASPATQTRHAGTNWFTWFLCCSFCR